MAMNDSTVVRDLVYDDLRKTNIDDEQLIKIIMHLLKLRNRKV